MSLETDKPGESSFLLSSSMVSGLGTLRSAGFLRAERFLRNLFFFSGLRPRSAFLSSSRYRVSILSAWLMSLCTSRLSMRGRILSRVCPSRRRRASTSVTHSVSSLCTNSATSVPGRPAFSAAFSRTLLRPSWLVWTALSSSSESCSTGDNSWTSFFSSDILTVLIVAWSSSNTVTGDWLLLDHLRMDPDEDLLDLVDFSSSSSSNVMGSGIPLALAVSESSPPLPTWYSGAGLPHRSLSSVVLLATWNASPGPISVLIVASSTGPSPASADMARLGSPPFSSFLDFLCLSTVSVDLVRRIIDANRAEMLDFTEMSSASSVAQNASAALVSASSWRFCLRCSSISFLALASLASSGGVRPLRSFTSIESGWAPNSWRTTFSPSGSTSSRLAARWTGSEPRSSIFLAAFGYARMTSCMISVGAPSTMAAWRGSSFHRNLGVSLPSWTTRDSCCTTMAPSLSLPSLTFGAGPGEYLRYTQTLASSGLRWSWDRASPQARC
mmetsp:Transcript_38425/g.91992  ORF Transcript_38425/g.91992 Transcript_38425/m.91992 type:complete len:498 (+) Transcript_38425:790-2283(+)